FFDPEFRESPHVTVVGHVVHSGVYPILPGVTRVSDAVRAAGGFRPGADLTAIRLLRLRPEVVKNDPQFARLALLSREQMTESEYESFRSHLAELSPDFRIDWQRLQSGGPALDPILEDGDAVRVDRINNTIRVDGQVARP